MTNDYSEITDSTSSEQTDGKVVEEVIQKLKEVVGGRTEDRAVEAEEMVAELDERTDDLTDVSGVGTDTADTLREAGFETITDLQIATQEELAGVDGIGMALAARIKADVGDVDCADMGSAPENIPAELAHKHWLCADECLLPVTNDTHIGAGLYHWVTDSYIPECSLWDVYEDSDVLVGDIENHEQYGFCVNLYYVPDRDVSVWSEKSTSGQIDRA